MDKVNLSPLSLAEEQNLMNTERLEVNGLEGHVYDEPNSYFEESASYWYLIYVPKGEIETSKSRLYAKIAVWNRSTYSFDYVEDIHSMYTQSCKTSILSLRVIDNIVFMVVGVEVLPGGVVQYAIVRAYSLDIASDYYNQSENLPVESRYIKYSNMLLIDKIKSTRFFDQSYIVRFKLDKNRCTNLFFSTKELGFDKYFYCLGARNMSDQIQILSGFHKLQIKYESGSQVRLDTYKLQEKGNWKHTFSFGADKSAKMKKMNISKFRSTLMAALK